MDFSILVGCGSGLTILLLALFMAKVPPHLLLNPEAILLVVLGTLTATLAGTGIDGVKRAFGTLFHKPVAEASLTSADALEQLMDVVAFAREEGLLALQPVIDGIELPFLRKGLMLALDNRPERFIKESLGAEMEMQHRHRLDDARVFENAAGYAPTMGVIGAVIGLVCILNQMHGSNATTLGPGVAAAFIATLYGVAFANLFLLPAANRIRHRAQNEWRVRGLLLEGVIGIYTNEHPLHLQDRLLAFWGDQHTQESTLATGSLIPHVGGKAANGYISRPGRQKASEPIFMDDDSLLQYRV